MQWMKNTRNSAQLFLSVFILSLVSNGNLMVPRYDSKNIFWRTLCRLVKTTGVACGVSRTWHWAHVTRGMPKPRPGESRRREPWEILSEGQRSRSTRKGKLVLNLQSKAPWPDIHADIPSRKQLMLDFYFWTCCFNEIHNPPITGWTAPAGSSVACGPEAPGNNPTNSFFGVCICFQGKYDSSELGGWNFDPN